MKFKKYKQVIVLMFFAFFILIVLSCKDKLSTNSSEDRLTLEITSDKIIIPADSVTLNRFDYIQFVNYNQKELLYLLNRKQNEIVRYDLNNPEYNLRIKIATEGPDGVGIVQGFTVHSDDSIYLISRNQSKIFLINLKGQLLRSIDYRYTEDGDWVYPVRIGMDPYKSLDIVGNRFYLPGMIEGNWSQLSPSDLLKAKICIEVDGINSTVKKMNFGYPPDYWKKGKKEPIFGRVFNGESFVYSFWADHYIYVTPNHTKYLRYYAGTSFIKEVEALPNEQSLESYLRYICKTGRYNSIIFDRFNKVYYRLAYLPIEVTKNTELMKEVRFPSRPVIIILSENFEHMGEVKLPERRFYPANFIVKQDGFYLSECHPDNKNVTDDFIVFTKLILKKSR